MMATTYQHPNQMQHSVQQGPQQHIQGHPGQPNAIAMQHMHPQVYQQQLARQSAPHHPPLVEVSVVGVTYTDAVHQLQARTPTPT